MKIKISLVILCVFMCMKVSAQNSFNGNWFYTSDRVNFELSLVQEQVQIQGNHCSVFDGGNFIDCADEEDVTLSGIITGDSINVIFESSFSMTKGKAVIKKINSTTILWKITESPSDSFYIPVEVVLTKRE